MAEATGLV